MSATALNEARNVTRPTRDAMLQRDPSVHQFWNEHAPLFEDAWKEWESADSNDLSLIHI